MLGPAACGCATGIVAKEPGSAQRDPRGRSRQRDPCGGCQAEGFRQPESGSAVQGEGEIWTEGSKQPDPRARSRKRDWCRGVQARGSRPRDPGSRVRGSWRTRSPPWLWPSCTGRWRRTSEEEPRAASERRAGAGAGASERASEQERERANEQASERAREVSARRRPRAVPGAAWLSGPEKLVMSPGPGWAQGPHSLCGRWDTQMRLKSSRCVLANPVGQQPTSLYPHCTALSGP